MRLLILAIVFLAALAETGTGPRSAGAAEDAPGVLPLRRGIGIHEWLNWSPLAAEGSRTYRWPPYAPLENWGSPADFRHIRAMGFDFVRLSVDPGPMLASPAKKRAEALRILETAVRHVTDSGLKVILDYHPVRQNPDYSRRALEVAPGHPLAERYRTMVRETALMLSHIGAERAALELMNEPHYYPCEGSRGEMWEDVQARLVRAARAAAPQLTFVVSGGCGGSAESLIEIDPGRLADDNLLYSFHHYRPHGFTHQGVDAPRWVTGLPWPSDRRKPTEVLALSYKRIDADDRLSAREKRAARAKVRKEIVDYLSEDHGYEAVEARFRKLRAWADKHGIPRSRLFLGEFSVMTASRRRGGALDSDRLRYLSAARRQAEADGMAWAYWEYSNPHGMSLTSFDAARRPDPVAIKALGLTFPPLRRSAAD